MIYATWCLSDNFGDKLTPYIIEKLSKQKAIWCPLESTTEKFMVVGSILNWLSPNTTAWGVGIANLNDRVPMKKVIAVRGQLSGIVTRLSNIEFKSIYGDPALLLPRMYEPKTEKKYKYGIVPHYADVEIVLRNLIPSDVLIINPFDDIEKFIENINQCEKIFSSSLHGLIVADAYGIPSQWSEFSYDRIGGDRTKYVDYYMSLGYDPIINPLDLREGIDFKKLYKTEVNLKELNIDLDKLYTSCPFLS